MLWTTLMERVMLVFNSVPKEAGISKAILYNNKDFRGGLKLYEINYYKFLHRNKLKENNYS
ncbi:hypothetical protein SLU01_28210 [Sporosarcina luteola]|uniref:Uncharacterized protein n=1 Tax=Sporosarcina luteola TaxID=582850 RepID=A0A511ZAN7_9BACL|nr:hypothetical protein SLU01_28210 [Sporosarcina luteola]